jgi:acetate---CoA ligase (ADP-forming)
MINDQLINPGSIVVIGGSNNIGKPGGKLLKNLIDHNFRGNLYVVNPKEENVQGVKSCKDVNDLPQVDLAILAVSAKNCLPSVEVLANSKGTRAFIILSAGFSEESPEGAEMENQIVRVIENTGGCLIGPNCIGIITQYHSSVFTSPVPKMDSGGVDFISGSGATAVFIMESGLPKGLIFSSVYSVGNSAQIGVEDILEHMDKNHDQEKSARVKLLYIENIDNPDKLLNHASSLIRKGCRIAAIKSGTSEAGSRAAQSHTGALASSDLAVDTLFRKAGIIRCYSREELVAVASVLLHPKIKGRNVAIVTHAGGPAVMLTDALSEGRHKIPKIEGKESLELLSMLNEGASVSNPIDLLATGTAQQLELVLDYCENKFEGIDAIMVIFGSSGLKDVYDAYEVLHQKMLSCKIPIFPVLPSIITASGEIEYFLSRGHINFPDEVLLGRAVSKVYSTPEPAEYKIIIDDIDIPSVRKLIEDAPDGFAHPTLVQSLLKAAGIPVINEMICRSPEEAVEVAGNFGYPVVMKVVGPVHKSDLNGVVLNIISDVYVKGEFERMIKIPGTEAVLVQKMLTGTELFIGAKYEAGFGHVILCGLGGIFVEMMQDLSSGLAPLNYDEAFSMIRSVKSYGIIRGARGKAGINEQLFADIIVRLSAMLRFATEIKELDLNPLIGNGNDITVVDARILIKKDKPQVQDSNRV